MYKNAIKNTKTKITLNTIQNLSNILIFIKNISIRRIKETLQCTKVNLKK